MRIIETWIVEMRRKNSPTAKMRSKNTLMAKKVVERILAMRMVAMSKTNETMTPQIKQKSMTPPCPPPKSKKIPTAKRIVVTKKTDKAMTPKML
jgi:hypothetical protein